MRGYPHGGTVRNVRTSEHPMKQNMPDSNEKISAILYPRYRAALALLQERLAKLGHTSRRASFAMKVALRGCEPGSRKLADIAERVVRDDRRRSGGVGGLPSYSKNPKT